MPKPIFQLLVHDVNRDRESWTWLAVVRFVGPLQMAPDLASTVSDGQIQEIFEFLASYDIQVRAAHESGPGRPFAREPWLQWFPNHILITQSGGLDV